MFPPIDLQLDKEEAKDIVCNAIINGNYEGSVISVGGNIDIRSTEIFIMEDNQVILNMFFQTDIRQIIYHGNIGDFNLTQEDIELLFNMESL